MSDDLMIETRGLSKRFGKLVAVDRLDLRVRRGQIHGFVGPNGAGKSTTMKMLTGCIKSTGGEGSINKHPLGSVEARRSLGYSPERPALYGDMTAWDYLVFMARLSGMTLGAAEDRAKEMLAWLEMDESYATKVAGFSAGMKQKLSIAQAMCHQPQLLILDEPTANLDPDGRMSLIEKLRGICREQGVTIFISSHILPELEQLVDTVSLIDKGRAVVEHSARRIRRTGALNRYVLNTSDNEKMLRALQGEACVQEIQLDGNGVIHITSHDDAALQAKVFEAVTQSGAVLEHFGKEWESLQDVYRKTVRRDK